ncbi:MAG: FtsQ-type POTRA domain-containing protein [Candidatus Magasanikbacteria bacterium]|nr:FtsQ-type POTRA domain-containing protein [Candidatus Magasanikbacteria bacterium]
MDKYIKSYGGFRQYEPPKKGGLFGVFKKKNKYSHSSGSKAIADHSASNRPSFIRPKAIVNYRGKIILSLLGSLIVAWLILMIYLPYFRINKINFEGLKIIDRSEIENYINRSYLQGGIIPHNNYFLISTKDITRDIQSKYAVDSVTVKKYFPGLINIQIEEKITTIIYDNGSSYSLLDKDGTVIKILEQYRETTFATTTASTTISENVSTSSYMTDEIASSTRTETHKPDFQKLSGNYPGTPILLDDRNKQVFEKKVIIFAPNFINSIIDWQKALRSEGIGDMRYFQTDNPSAGVKAYLNKNWYLLIQPTNPMSNQIVNLKTIISNRDISPVEYIDLRFGERVFWK